MGGVWTLTGMGRDAVGPSQGAIRKNAAWERSQGWRKAVPKSASKVWSAGRSGQGGGPCAGWWMTAAGLGEGRAGFDNTGGQRSKLGVREDTPWFPELKLDTSWEWATLGELWSARMAPGCSK